MLTPLNHLSIHQHSLETLSIMASYVFEEGTVTPPRPVQKKQLLVNVVDGLAKFQANALYAEYPYSATSYEAGYRKITYALFANAVNGLAWHLHDILGPGKDFPTLAYIGPNDLRYNALLLAAVKAGYKVRESSPWLSSRQRLGI